ncbi:MAG: HlyD family efflux transporter periplasmic adaptor subunit [Acidimicrobiia bacterium]|nr:HlyD family efflux transporter periplasmic adaptor subunit [Acidimicrobiia bacterium]
MRTPQISRVWHRAGNAALALVATCLVACQATPPTDRVRVSGQVEATEVQIAGQVGGRLLELAVTEGQRVAAGDLIARLDTADAALARELARAERSQVVAQVRLLRAGSRVEDIHQAEWQSAAARSEQAAADADLVSAQVDVDRFESLLASNSGSRKQRDDAAARRNVARGRVQAAKDRAAAADAVVARLKVGARPEEIAWAEARVAAADAQIRIFEKAIADATLTSPIAGVVTTVVADAGETVAPRAPLVVITDLDHAWANVYVDEPAVPRLKLGQSATLYTDGGLSMTGTVSYVSPRAEFTPRNVQTAQDRSQLVYRLKIAVDNTAGVLKSGMPVEAELIYQ